MGTMNIAQPRLDDLLLRKLEDAASRRAETHDAETHGEYLRLLQQFSDLVLRNQLPGWISPPDCPGAAH